MENYLIFFGKSSDFTTYAFNEDGYIPKFEKNVFKDFDLLETRFLINDQLDNEITIAKYNFEYLSKRYSLLKTYGCAMAKNADRVAGCSYGVAFISQFDINLSEENIDLLNSVRSKFKELVIENNRFTETDFLAFVEPIWKVFNNANYFSKIEVKDVPYVSANSSPLPLFIKNYIGLEEITRSLLEMSSRLYLSSDLEHIKRSIKYYGGGISIYTISNGNIINYTELEEKQAREKSNLEDLEKEKGKNYSKKESELLTLVNSLKLEKSTLEISIRRLNKTNSLTKKLLYLSYFVSLLFAGLACFLYIQHKLSFKGLKPALNKNGLTQAVSNNTNLYVLKSWTGEFNLNLVGTSENFLSLDEYNKLILKKIKPFIDKEGNTHSDKYVLKSGNKIPDFIKGKYGIIRRMSKEQKNNFK